MITGKTRQVKRRQAPQLENWPIVAPTVEEGPPRDRYVPRRLMAASWHQPRQGQNHHSTYLGSLYVHCHKSLDKFDRLSIPFAQKHGISQRRHYQTWQGARHRHNRHPEDTIIQTASHRQYQSSTFPLQPCQHLSMDLGPAILTLRAHHTNQQPRAIDDDILFKLQCPILALFDLPQRVHNNR